MRTHPTRPNLPPCAPTRRPCAVSTPAQAVPEGAQPVGPLTRARVALCAAPHGSLLCAHRPLLRDSACGHAHVAARTAGTRLHAVAWQPCAGERVALAAAFVPRSLCLGLCFRLRLTPAPPQRRHGLPQRAVRGAWRGAGSLGALRVRDMQRRRGRRDAVSTRPHVRRRCSPARNASAPAACADALRTRTASAARASRRRWLTNASARWTASR
jgi:hypothetical protein